MSSFLFLLDKLLFNASDANCLGFKALHIVCVSGVTLRDKIVFKLFENGIQVINLVDSLFKKSFYLTHCLMLVLPTFVCKYFVCFLPIMAKDLMRFTKENTLTLSIKLSWTLSSEVHCSLVASFKYSVKYYVRECFFNKS
jgi:hypothetical protein